MKQVFLNRGFQIHLGVYIAVNSLLIVIDLMGSPGKIWFFWPLLGWGIGIVSHAAAVYFAVKKQSKQGLGHV